MLTKKKKLSRKEIKEDKLVEFYYKSLKFFDQNKQKVLMYAGIFLAAILLVYFFIYQKSQQNEQAGIHLGAIINSFNAGAYLEAIEGKEDQGLMGLKQIVAEYGGTENGETAKIYLADAFSLLGNYEEAYKYYKDYDGSIDFFKAASFAGQAAYFASKGDYQQAADLYLKAASVSETVPSNPDNLLLAAKYYIETGENQTAKELLDRITEKYKQSAASREVGKYYVFVD